VEAEEAVPFDATDLITLVEHRWAVPEDHPLEEVEKVFRARGVAFVALVSDGMASGLCSRVQLGSLLGSRFGFSMFSRSPARDAAVAEPLIFSRGTPVREVIERSLGRQGGAFHEDVLLVDENRRLIGLIPVERLAHLQIRLVREQLGQLETKQEALRRQNLELFQTNHALRQAQGLYAGLFESNAIGVALLDAKGQVQAHNARLADLLNLGPAPVAIASLAGWMTETDRPVFEAMLAAHERPGAAAPSTREFILQVPGRGPRPFRFSTGWIRETGQICACLDDVTEQRILEREMMRQEKQRLLDTLVGGIAHELNNKLTPIQGFTELLILQATGENREHLTLVGQSVKEAARIVRQLLQLSKPEAGDPAPVDLRTVVDESLLILKFQLRESRCQVSFHRPLEPVTVMGDASQLKQVVINLVLNALQAMEQTRAPVLGLRVGGEAGEAFLSVADNGTGIASENLSRIFDPFFTTKGPDRGSGLGLSICFSIARQFGGDIAVESEPGAGSIFTMQLPAIASLALPARGVPAGATKRRGRRRCRVLVVDDEAVVRMLLQEMLRSNFFCDVDLARTGAEALELTGHATYDLVVSDVRMPELSGLDFYRQLLDRCPALAGHFVLITGYPGESYVREEIAQLDLPVLSKPFTQTSLIEICHPHLAREDEAVSA
jgi:two-component system NtrC family sensor kinase